MPTVRIIEDDRNLSLAIGELLASVGTRSVLYGSVEAFLHAPGDDPGCLILDVRLPGLSGLELQRRAPMLGMDLPMVFISGHGDIAMGVSAMKAGAIDFLSKPFNDQALLDAVSAALEEDTRRRCESARRDGVALRHTSLTPREREVLCAVAQGLRNREIATRLGLSEVTVKMHRGGVMRKMGAETLVDLLKMVADLEPLE